MLVPLLVIHFPIHLLPIILALLYSILINSLVFIHYGFLPLLPIDIRHHLSHFTIHFSHLIIHFPHFNHTLILPTNLTTHSLVLPLLHHFLLFVHLFPIHFHLPHFPPHFHSQFYLLLSFHSHPYFHLQPHLPLRSHLLPNLDFPLLPVHTLLSPSHWPLSHLSHPLNPPPINPPTISILLHSFTHVHYV